MEIHRARVTDRGMREENERNARAAKRKRKRESERKRDALRFSTRAERKGDFKEVFS